MWKLPERGSYGEGNLKMWLTHRYFEQVKQAEKLDQKVPVHRLIICRRDEKKVMKSVHVSSSRPKRTRWRASAYRSAKQIIGTG
jgi:hypothetical protein